MTRREVAVVALAIPLPLEVLEIYLRHPAKIRKDFKCDREDDASPLDGSDSFSREPKTLSNYAPISSTSAFETEPG